VAKAIRIMMRAPTQSAIDAVELRVAQSRLQTQNALHRGRLALRATIARPASVVTLSAVAAIVGYWLTRYIRPPRPRRAQTGSASANGASATKMATFTALLWPTIMRYAKQQFPVLMRQALQVWTARQSQRAQP
jgi:hypothetical protein